VVKSRVGSERLQRRGEAIIGDRSNPQLREQQRKQRLFLGEEPTGSREEDARRVHRVTAPPRCCLLSGFSLLDFAKRAGTY
jgi:hypothetical protein